MNKAAVKNVKAIITVASAKGGVGKSTTSVNLALGLAQTGLRVGLLDADIYGPSQPHMLGVTSQPDVVDGQKLKPIMAHGLQTMSIGYLLDSDKTPVIWRGPMATRMLMQLIYDTAWDNLDVLIIDLPPGTGDIQLTLSQKIPVTGAVVVTTPQEVALNDARKGIEMFQKVKIPVLGIVENMGMHICSTCGHQEAIFGAGGGEALAEQYQVAFLGHLPLNKQIQEDTQAGNPTVASAPDSEVGQLYQAISEKVKSALDALPKDYSHKFPKIVIEDK